MAEEITLDNGNALLRLDYDSKCTMADLLERLAGMEEASTLKTLRIGAWEHCYEKPSEVALEPLLRKAGAFPELESIFFAEIEQDECEISWINHVDLGRIFPAFPKLLELQIRGGNGLRLSDAAHPRLKTLRLESGGLPGEVVQDIAQGNFPALEHLELWLGCEEYGGSASLQDVGPILAGASFPRLRFLGLMNWEKANNLALALKTAPILERIEVLDLSMGTLTDEGARALLSNDLLKRLKKVRLDENFISDDMITKLRASLGDILEPGNQEEPDEYEYDGKKYCETYCSVSE